MKIIKVYYYAFQSIAVLFMMTLVRYLLGDESIMNMERLIICIVGGFFVGSFWLLIDTIKSKYKKAKI